MADIGRGSLGCNGMSKWIPCASWLERPIVCPHCGNHGGSGEKWEKHASTPFKLVEEVVRSWEFSACADVDGRLRLEADTDTDEVDWESGTDLRFECMACFGQFGIPDDAEVSFEGA